MIVFSLLFTGCTTKHNSISTSATTTKQDEQKDSKPSQENILYTNKKLGFSLKIPSSWRDSYSIVKSDDGTGIDFYFIGKSKTSQAEFEDSPSVKGLYLFSIATEASIQDSEDSVDSILDVGTAHGTKYISYTGTDCSICILKDEETEADSKELDLLKADWQKVSTMLDEKETVLKTFQSVD
ncbi:hypothetical protein [Paenibacillus puldeungensis]|uniref:hypothetical protein n=1 Tax=Paenibacillus puldeungensis TaxID=696536 RepID=UPI0036D3E55C